MALGKPSITTPNALDLRAIASAVGSARQRIEAIERALASLEGTAGQSSTTATAQIGALRTQLVALASRVTALESAATLDTGVYVAGGPISAGQCVVAIGADTVAVADPSDPFRMFGVIGVARGTVAGSSVRASPASGRAVGRSRVFIGP